VPSTTLHDLGGSKSVHVAHIWISFGLSWYAASARDILTRVSAFALTASASPTAAPVNAVPISLRRGMFFTRSAISSVVDGSYLFYSAAGCACRKYARTRRRPVYSEAIHRGNDVVDLLSGDARARPAPSPSPVFRATARMRLPSTSRAPGERDCAAAIPDHHLPKTASLPCLSSLRLSYCWPVTPSPPIPYSRTRRRRRRCRYPGRLR
jgi:hypothetical protein